MIRVAVFDFDGTLVDSNSVKERAFGDVVASLPGGLSALEAARLAGGDRYRIFQEVARRTVSGGDAAEIARVGRTLTADYTRRCQVGIGYAPERRGATRALRALLSRGLKLYINTATPQKDISVLLQARNWRHFFKGVYGAPRSKADNLRTILRRERIAPGATIMIGDSPDDLAAAEEVGTWFVGVTAELRILPRPPFWVRDLVTLPPLINRLMSIRSAPR